MDLFPIRVSISEGTPQSSEIVFINASKYSLAYFLANILTMFPGVSEREELTGVEESLCSRLHSEIDTQLKRYTSDLAVFSVRFPLGRIPVHLDFQVETFLKIEDWLIFRLPIGNTPEVYARDLFLTYGLPEGELLTLFSFYIREEILRQIKIMLQNESLEVTVPRTGPKISLIPPGEWLSQHVFAYDTPGRVSVVKEQERRRKRRG
ncbi:hypothetical protein NEHOM01_0411 [Nematocida homosporus]|uniref:uncharacterized protein n=1 Tax=Nematocida homosporus TaxID=1912981 RepID=UPI00221EF8AB|nr:uncharacterized protein NEHOM01_0411 [Nematocida homosporus]KAI5184809.1 hypothetical protein NEHOM01_0411 [Nematocida homosporus]